MRFRAPRSVSPSPVRRKPRHSSTFGLQSDYEDSDSDDPYANADSSEAESVLSSSSDSFCYGSESEVPITLTNPAYAGRFLRNNGRINDTVVAIRLRTQHHDPYEEWERQTRIDAFRSAREDLTAIQSQLLDKQDSSRIQEKNRRAALHTQQMKEIEGRLENLRMRQRADEDRMKAAMKERQRRIWEGIEGVIKIEEDKVKAKLEEERKRQEEQERKRQEEELRKKALAAKQQEEQRKKEEEAKREAEEKQRRDKEEEEAKQLREAQELKIAEREQSEKTARGELGMTRPEQDWNTASLHLQDLKIQTMRPVKGNPPAKTEWSKLRRQMTSKIGQITDDAQEINRLSLQLYQILHPPQQPPRQPIVYKALLYSLSKAILLQAETEVTAEKKSARPLARVAFNLLETLDGFPEVFFAKLLQRAGGWPVPYWVPSEDFGSGPWKSDEERNRAAERAWKKAMKYRKCNDNDDMESHSEYTTRVSGLMRVYFHILQFSPQKPMHPMFQLPRYWIWFTRFLMNKRLLDLAIAPQLIYTALDVMGSHARKIWGRQWNKILGLIYDGVTTGYDKGRLIGGKSAEGAAARSRVQTEIERILSEG